VFSNSKSDIRQENQFILYFLIHLGEFTKSNAEFKFDTEIFVDRYLYENRERYLEIHKKVKQLKEKQK
jgi:hypothetical protein